MSPNLAGDPKADASEESPCFLLGKLYIVPRGGNFRAGARFGQDTRTGGGNETRSEVNATYTCRDYKSERPPDERLWAIAEAAIQAPSGMNRQAWRVIVVKDRELMREMEAEGLAFLAGMEDPSG